MHIDELLRPHRRCRFIAHTADLSALSVDVMMSALRRYSALSRPQPICRPTANPPHTPILKLIICCLVLLAIALSACNDQSKQVDPRLKHFVIIDSRVLIDGNGAE